MTVKEVEKSLGKTHSDGPKKCSVGAFVTARRLTIKDGGRKGETKEKKSLNLMAQK